MERWLLYLTGFDHFFFPLLFLRATKEIFLAVFSTSKELKTVDFLLQKKEVVPED